MKPKHYSVKFINTGLYLKTVLSCVITSLYLITVNCQKINLDGTAGGKRFDGIGAVSGGGATSVLLKDYPEPQRSQILDLLFKPKFGASISTLLVEIPGDGNSTQGSEPSHMHTRNDLNYSRGYEWWLMSEAKKRDPSITLDANIWSCPKWIGNGNVWSQDLCNYDANWIKGLKNVYGLNLNAIGCRNEKGVNETFVKMLRTTLDRDGFYAVKIHAFDNWGKEKFDWCKDMLADSALRASVQIMSAHTLSEIPASKAIIKLSNSLGKPIWDTEEHVYKDGFDCEISLVEAFNDNFIESGATKIVNWYLVASTYSIEPFPLKPAMLVAREPWSGYYYTRPVLWGYAHYGQFCKVGWEYLNGACGKLEGGGSYVTLKSPGNDYSIIVETKDAKKIQKIKFKISGGLSDGKLCVWRSNANEQFVRLNDITPVNGKFEVTLDPQSIYSISTTRGQQKGSFQDVPKSKPFPFPYYEAFNEYKDAQVWGYLPHYTADIDGVFEIAERPDKQGKCLQQVVKAGAQSWAPEWMPYAILGNPNWKNYDVSANVYRDKNGWVGIMGRVTSTGSGYGCKPNGYYMTLSANGTCSLYVSNEKEKSKTGRLIAKGRAPNFKANQWHTLMLRFSGSSIKGFVDNNKILSATDTTFSEGMVGLVSGSEDNADNLAMFDNVIVKSPGTAVPSPNIFSQKVTPIYKSE